MNVRRCHNHTEIAGPWRGKIAIAGPAEAQIRQRFAAARAGYNVGASGERLLAVTALADFCQQREYRLAWRRDDRNAI